MEEEGNEDCIHELANSGSRNEYVVSKPVIGIVSEPLM